MGLVMSEFILKVLGFGVAAIAWCFEPVATVCWFVYAQFADDNARDGSKDERQGWEV